MERRRMRDYARQPRNRYGEFIERRTRDYGRSRDYGEVMHDRRMRDYDDRQRDYGERRRREYDDMRRDYGRDYLDYDDRRYPLYEDYGESEEYLDEDDLMQWSKRLMREVPDSDKGMFSKEMIEHKAKEMGIEFGKDFTFAEFYTTALMLYTDFRKVLGGGNIDLYVRLAQAWLMDDDINLDAGEKLCVYYDRIVNG